MPTQSMGCFDVLGQLRVRTMTPEIMDQPGLEPSRHRAALRGLARINMMSGSVGILWPPLAALASEIGTVRLLDLACGGGDVTIGLWKKARNCGIDLQATGMDVSTTAIEVATHRARESSANVRFIVGNALADNLPRTYDAIICSLFLHHLTNAEAMQLLQKAVAAGPRLVLVNDLIRCRTGLMLAHMAGLFAGSDVVRIDGPRSVRAAFTMAEVQRLAQGAGLSGATLERRWPCRYLLCWRRPPREGVWK